MINNCGDFRDFSIRRILEEYSTMKSLFIVRNFQMTFNFLYVSKQIHPNSAHENIATLWHIFGVIKNRPPKIAMKIMQIMLVMRLLSEQKFASRLLPLRRLSVQILISFVVLR